MYIRIQNLNLRRNNNIASNICRSSIKLDVKILECGEKKGKEYMILN